MSEVIKKFLSEPDSRNLKQLSVLVVTAFNAGQPWG